VPHQDSPDTHAVVSTVSVGPAWEKPRKTGFHEAGPFDRAANSVESNEILCQLLCAPSSRQIPCPATAALPGFPRSPIPGIAPALRPRVIVCWHGVIPDQEIHSGS
jgi:hypothetical protein